jgi:hypothetical protein
VVVEVVVQRVIHFVHHLEDFPKRGIGVNDMCKLEGGIPNGVLCCPNGVGGTVGGFPNGVGGVPNGVGGTGSTGFLRGRCSQSHRLVRAARLRCS